MAMRTSAEGRAVLMTREGCRLSAYRDTAGVWTIGVGHTGRAAGPPVRPGMTVTRAEAEGLFAADLAPFEAAVNEAVRVPMTRNQFDACVSLAFNIGAKGFAGSTVAHKLNVGLPRAAADAFLLWERPPELKARRIAERAQFLAESPLARPPLPVPKPAAVPATGRKLGFWDRVWIALTFRKAA